MASLADLASGSHTPACARARTHRVHSDVGNVSSQMPHLRGIAQGATWCGVPCPRGVRESGGVAGHGVKMWHHLPTWRQGARWRRQTWRQNVASLAHVASGSQVASPNVASKRGVTCPRGVREPGGVAKRGVKKWRHLPTWRQGARWRRQTWRQNVASLAHVASGLGARWRLRTWRQNVASIAYVASGRHVRSPELCQRSREWPPSQNVASSVTCPRGVTKPHVASKRGVRRHRSTWRHRTWRQNVASRSQAPRHVSSKCVFSCRAICAPPQATTLISILPTSGLSSSSRRYCRRIFFGSFFESGP